MWSIKIECALGKREGVFLNSDQLSELTERKRAKEQIAWLSANGFRFVVSAAGNPRVLVSEVEARLSSKTPKQKLEAPDFDFLKAS